MKLSGTIRTGAVVALGASLFVYALTASPQTTSAVTFSKGVKFNTTVNVNGTLSKGSGSFVIDHPLDPANKLLAHSFVESPDVKNIYDGIVRLNWKGEATIKLPDYFDALNKDVRYQFFPIDTAMPGLYIKEEEHDNMFVIAGGKAFGLVSWQVTGIRHDKFIEDNPINVEVPKGPDSLMNRGECIYEPLCQ